MAGTRDSLVARNVLVGNLNVDNPMQGSVGTAFNPTYALVNEAGAQIVLFISSVDYKMYAQLKDKYGNLIYTSNIIDLPLESVVMNGRYDSTTKEVVLTLVNGNEIRFSVADLVRGLVDEDQLEEVLGGYWSKEELTEEDIENWNNKQNYLNQGENIQIYSDLSLKGQIQQDSTTGKNLLPISPFNNGYSLYTLTDDVVTQNNTTSASWAWGWARTFFRTTLPAGTYTLIMFANTKSINDSAEFRVYKNDDTMLADSGNQQKDETGSVTFTLNEETQIGIVAKMYDGAWKFMLISGGTPDYNYESYTNGPAPNPDYPQEIHNVSGDNTIEICGKNILPLSASDLTLNRYIGNDGSEQTSTSGNYYGSYTYIDFNFGGKTIALSDGLELAFYDSSKTFISYIGRNQSRVQNVPNNCSYIRIDCYKDNINEMQIEFNSSQTPYEPYIGQSQLISLGVENLFDNSSAYLFSNNKYVATSNDYSTRGKIQIKPNTYYLFSITSGTINDGKAYFFDENMTLLSSTNTRTSAVLTPSNAKYMGWYATSGNAFEGNKYATIIEGNVWQYVSENPIELNKISTYQDYIYRQDNKWYLHKEISKVVLDGSEEGWNVRQGSNPNLYVYYLLNNYVQNSVKENGVNKSNRFIEDNTSGLIQVDGGFRITEYNLINRIFLCVNSNIANTINNFKTWLSTHNTIVYYPLAEPTDTEITGTLQEQLNNLSSILSNNWIENISQENNDLPFIINYDNTKLTIDVPGANADQGGVIKTSDSYATATADGVLTSQTKTYAQYNLLNNNAFVSKGTLENVITGKELVNKTYVDEADAIFEDDLFGEDTIEGQGTEITLDNTANAPIQLELKPNTHQDSTTGKNLAEFGTTKDTNVFSYSSFQYNNINVTKIDTGGSFYASYKVHIPVAGTYKFIGNVGFGNGASSQPFYVYYDRLWGTELKFFSITAQGNFVYSLAFPEAGDYIIGVYGDGDINKTYSLKDFMCVANNVTDTTYEPFTNGPAPNPDYPQEIHKVSGDNTIKVQNKNIINLSNLTTLSSSGITPTINNNEIILNGTAINASTLIPFQTTGSIIKAGTYTFSIRIDSGSFTRPSGDVAFYIRNSSNTILSVITLSLFTNNHIIERTLSIVEDTELYFQVYCNSANIIFNNLVMQVQVEKGTQVTNYIKHQEQSQLISLGVENLFNKETAQLNVGINTSNGNTYNDSNLFSSDYIPISINTPYVANSASTTGNRVFGACYDSNKVYLGAVSTGVGERTFTVTNTNAKYVRITGQKVNIDTYQIEKGLKINSYTPYGTTSIEYCEIGDYKDEFIKSTGKNLFDKDTANFVKGYYLNASGIETAGENWGVYYIPLISNKSYTISGCQPNGGVNFCWFDKNKTFISNIGQKQDRTVTSPSNAKYLGLSLVWNTSITGYDSQLMLNEGPTALFYEPYGTKWYLKKNTKKVVLDGSEIYSNQNSYYVIAFSQITPRPMTNSQLISNYFENTREGGNGGIWAGLSGIAFNKNGLPSTITDTTTLKSWLSTHNTEVCYILEIPEYILLNDTLQKQLDRLQGLLSYDGQTNISQENNDLPFKIKVSAFKDTTKGNISGLYAQIGDISSILDIINGEEV